MLTSVASSGRSYVLDGGQGVYYAASLCRLQWLAVAALTCWMVDKVCIMQCLCACWMVDKVCISVASSGRSYVLDGGQGVYYAVPLC